MQSIIKKYNPKTISIDGIDKNIFVISKELFIQEPLKYLQNIIVKNTDARKLPERIHDKNDINHLFDIINIFIKNPTSILMESSDLESIMLELENLTSWEIKQEPHIYVQKDNKRVDLSLQSPGTRANLLMEFILSEDKEIPLLIDQPEDNIDNFTIANKLTNWISLMKEKRQLIIVTHDPNIVVNADAENVIICEQKENGLFNYNNGPLESNYVLDSIVKILEGGKEALERRMGKYGE